MNETARQTLARIVTQYGQGIADDPRRCEGLLRDLCGDARREINVLITAVKEKVVSDLQAGAGIPSEVLVSRAVKKMHDNAGIAEDLAHWAVESWALALGIITPETLSGLNQRTKSARPPSTLAKGWYYSRSGAPHQGPISSTELRRLAACGKLLRTDSLWKDGMEKWMAAGSIKNLFEDSAPSRQTNPHSFQRVTAGPAAPSSPPLPVLPAMQSRNVPVPAPSGGNLRPNNGNLVLVLGILSVFCCAILGPVAWILGSHDLKEMAAGRLDREGETKTRVGQIIGIVMTLLMGAYLGVWLLLVCLVAVLGDRPAKSRPTLPVPPATSTTEKE